MDRFRTIESFVRVAHSGSFTKAARQLGLSRALISRRIIELEARLGVRLLNRSTRSVSLTAEGRAYLSRCKQVLDDMEAAEREIARGAKTPLGGIRVLAPKSLAYPTQLSSFPRYTHRSAFHFRSAISAFAQQTSLRKDSIWQFELPIFATQPFWHDGLPR